MARTEQSPGVPKPRRRDVLTRAVNVAKVVAANRVVRGGAMFGGGVLLEGCVQESGRQERPLSAEAVSSTVRDLAVITYNRLLEVPGLAPAEVDPALPTTLGGTFGDETKKSLHVLSAGGFQAGSTFPETSTVSVVLPAHEVSPGSWEYDFDRTLGVFVTTRLYLDGMDSPPIDYLTQMVKARREDQDYWQLQGTNLEPSSTLAVVDAANPDEKRHVLIDPATGAESPAAPLTNRGLNDFRELVQDNVGQMVILS